MQIELQGAMNFEDGSLKPSFISFLRRARDRPLHLDISEEWSISISGGVARIVQFPCHPQRSLEALLRVVGHSLTRLVLKGTLTQGLLCLPSGLFPSLESFVCNMPYGLQSSRFIAEEVLQSCLFDAPALRRVALNTGSPVLLMEQFALPWEKLTHFLEADRRVKRPHFLTQTLPRCHELRWLRVVLKSEDLLYCEDSFDELPETVYDNMAGGVITLPNLKTLRIGPIFDIDLCYPLLFSKYEFPNLRTLRLSS